MSCARPAERWADWVARCAAVSPTPLPFCGPNASRAEIEAEIARGCDLLDDEAPPFCVAYRDR